MLKSKGVLISLLLGVTVIGFTNCPGPNSRNNILKIGAILDLTGPAASFGQMQRQGIELAVDNINSSPRCGYTVSPIIEDSRLDAKTAITAATKLIQQDKVSAVCSITGSSMALTTAPLFNQAKVPVVDSLSSAPGLTSDGGAYYFRVQPSDNFAGSYLVQWARENSSLKRAAIIYAESDWGQGLRDSISSASKAQGLNILTAEAARLGETDFRPTILRVRRMNPDLIFLVAHPQEAGLIVKQLAELNYRIPIMGSDSLSTDEVRTAAGKALDGVMFCLSSPGEGSIYDNFQKKFKERFGKEATINSIKPYDTVMLIYETACKSGPNPDEIRKALEQVKDFQGISGPIAFDENGDILNPKYDRFIYHGETFTKVEASQTKSASASQ
jgi:branched-chain amino acid transport system substrate-binding protein